MVYKSSLHIAAWNINGYTHKGYVKYVLKRVSLGSKDCFKELKLDCAYFLGQTS